MSEDFEWTMEQPFKWTKELESICSRDRLGGELLKDPKGELPILVWKLYFNEHSDQWRPVLNWCIDPSHPDVAYTDPQKALDEALPLVGDVIKHLESDRPKEALKAAQRALELLVHGASFLQPKRGQAASVQHLAVRAYVIRKFNPHPKEPGESSVSWRKVADLLFRKDGKCSRCQLARHESDSACVKALITAVRRVHAAMKHDGIPI